jgi:hypothetical protein
MFWVSACYGFSWFGGLRSERRRRKNRKKRRRRKKIRKRGGETDYLLCWSLFLSVLKRSKKD